MIDTETVKRIDPSLSDLSEEELEEIRLSLYEFAQLAFEVYWYRKNGSKNPLGLFPPAEVRE